MFTSTFVSNKSITKLKYKNLQNYYQSRSNHGSFSQRIQQFNTDRGGMDANRLVRAPQVMKPMPNFCKQAPGFHSCPLCLHVLFRWNLFQLLFRSVGRSQLGVFVLPSSRHCSGRFVNMLPIVHMLLFGVALFAVGE